MALSVIQLWVEINLRKKAAASCGLLFALHLMQLLPSQCLQSTLPQKIVKELGKFSWKIYVVIKELVDLR